MKPLKPQSTLLAGGSPAGNERVAAVSLPHAPEAAAQAARKIPHYGKYSYLAFSGGINRAKGTWAADSSPTVYQFPRGNPSRDALPKYQRKTAFLLRQVDEIPGGSSNGIAFIRPGA